MDESPLQYRLDADRSLVITWRDGHQTVLSCGELRRACPCAGCREEREARRRGRLQTGSPEERSAAEGEPRGAGDGSIQLLSLDPVGRYGLAPVWSDGHRTGIYPWSFLRSLCGCIQCRMERGTA